MSCQQNQQPCQAPPKCTPKSPPKRPPKCGAPCSPPASSCCGPSSGDCCTSEGGWGSRSGSGGCCLSHPRPHLCLWHRYQSPDCSEWEPSGALAAAMALGAAAERGLTHRGAAMGRPKEYGPTSLHFLSTSSLLFWSLRCQNNEVFSQLPVPHKLPLS